MSTTASIPICRPASAKLLSHLFGFRAVLVGSLLLIVFLWALRPMTDPDIGWHLRNAQYLFQAHRMIRSDMYAFTTAGMPWINHEWLAEVPYYLGWRLWGADGLFIVMSVALEAIFLGVYWLAFLHSGNERAAWLVTGCAVLFGTVSFGPRTLLFGWMALVFELLLLAVHERSRGPFPSGGLAGRRALWLLPPLFLVWVNLHGSWLIGFVLLLCDGGCGLIQVRAGCIENTRWNREERRHFGIIVLLCLSALFVNPYGWQLVAYPFDLAFRQKLNVATIEEWQALDWHSVRGRIFFLALALSFLAQLLRKRTWTLHHLAFLGIGIYAAMTYSRFLFLAAILVLPLLARDIAWGAGNTNRTKQEPMLNGALLALMVLGAGLGYRAKETAIKSEAAMPVKAARVLATLPGQGALLNEFSWGGYLELHVPGLPVMIDSRTDIFERKGVLRDYLDAVQIRSSFAVLDKYRIRYVLLEPKTPLVYLLQQSPDWKTDYGDETAILMERLPAGHAKFSNSLR